MFVEMAQSVGRTNLRYFSHATQQRIGEPGHGGNDNDWPLSNPLGNIARRRLKRRRAFHRRAPEFHDYRLHNLIA
jgi:hypothetical protein